MSNTTVPTNTGKIFNVEEPTGKELTALETTAAQAKIEAPNRVEAMHVSENAEKAQYVANQAASVAKSFGSDFTGEPTTAAGQFKGDASRVTNQAVAEGKHDVDQAKAVGAGYVEQAKSLANTAIETAQNYLPTSLGGKPVDPTATTTTTTNPNAPSMTTQATNVTANAYGTAVATAAPLVDQAKGVAIAAAGAVQPAVQAAAFKVSGALGTAGTAPLGDRHQTGLPDASAPLEGETLNRHQTALPATTAPLQSGPHTVDTPYPAKKPAATEIAANQQSPMASRN